MISVPLDFQFSVYTIEFKHIWAVSLMHLGKYSHKMSIEWFDPLMFTDHYLSQNPEDNCIFASHSQEFAPGAHGLLVAEMSSGWL